MFHTIIFCKLVFNVLVLKYICVGADKVKDQSGSWRDCP
jgi:hypothetical protein